MSPGRPVHATMALAVVTTVVYLAAQFIAVPHLAYQAGFIPFRTHGDLGVPDSVPILLTPITAAFLHAGPLHLCFNVMMLVFCGRQVETVLQATRTLILYVAGAYGAALAHFLVSPGSRIPMVGASGAISALIATYALMYGRNNPAPVGPLSGTMVRALWLAASWTAIQWILAQVASDQPFAIATAAHVGGFITGLLLTYPLLEWRYRSA